MDYRYEKYLIYLCRCVIDGTTPDVDNNINYSVLYRYSLAQKLDGFVYMALEPLGVMPKLDEECYMYSDFRALQIETEQEEYCREFTSILRKKGIDHLVVKGRNIAELYPYSHLRRSSDVDILLLDKNKLGEAGAIMRSLGFETESENENNPHDVYCMNNRIFFELHRSLFPEDTPWHKPALKINERIIPIHGQEHSYLMTPEDLYVFMIAHTAKHVKFSGIGIRMILDIYVYWKKYKNKVNYDLINNTLKEFNLITFEHNLKALAKRWFENDTTENDITDELERFVLSGGWNGNIYIHSAQQIATDIGGTKNHHFARIKQYLNIIFLPYYDMRRIYPSLRKKAILLPFCWIHRICKTILHKHTNISSVLNSVKDTNLDAGQKMNEFNRKIGL